MNISIIKYLIDKKLISKAWGRLLESAFICWLTYFTWAIAQWELISINWLIIAIVTPIYLYLSKLQRGEKEVG